MGKQNSPQKSNDLLGTPSESLDLSKKLELVDSKLTTLSMTRQAKLLEVNRSTLYYKPVPFSNDKLRILNQIDEIYTDNPEYGYAMYINNLKKMAIR